MFRNYFMPGFAVALLGLFAFSRPPAAPTSGDKGSRRSSAARAGDGRNPQPPGSANAT